MTEQKKPPEIETGAYLPREKNKSSNRINVIIAILMAIVLWMYVLGEVNPETTIELKNVSIKIIGEEVLNEKGLMLTDEEKYKTNVLLTGKRSDISKVDSGKVDVSADVTTLDIGKSELPIKIILPEGVLLSQLNPPKLEVNIEQKISKEIPLTIDYKGKETEELETIVKIISPENVRVTGPASAIRKVNNVAIEIDLLTVATGTIKPAISARTANGKEISNVVLDRNEAVVFITKLFAKEVPLDINVYDSANAELTKTLKEFPEKIIICGAAANLANIEKIETERLDLSQITADNTLEVYPILPDGVSLSRFNKNIYVEVSVTRIDSKAFIYNSEEISIIGIQNGFTAEILTEEVSVTLVASEETISTIKSENIKLSVDLSGFEIGEHEIKLAITSTEKLINNFLVSPETVIVRIIE